MSLFFDNNLLFDTAGHLTDAGLDAVKDGTLDDLGSLEAAEHLTFCDYCLQRYTALLDAAPACLQTPMRDLVPQVQALMRLRSFRILTNRYVSAAAAVVLAFALWQFGAFTPPKTAIKPSESIPKTAVSTVLNGTFADISNGIHGVLSGFTATAQDGLAQLNKIGGQPAKGE